MRIFSLSFLLAALSMPAAQAGVFAKDLLIGKRTLVEMKLDAVVDAKTTIDREPISTRSGGMSGVMMGDFDEDYTPPPLFVACVRELSSVAKLEKKESEKKPEKRMSADEKAKALVKANLNRRYTTRKDREERLEILSGESVAIGYSVYFCDVAPQASN